MHAQPAAVLTDWRREVTKRAADLCRAQPAVFAAVAREADRLRAQGLSDEEALAQACGLDGPLLLASGAGGTMSHARHRAVPEERAG